MTEDNLAPEPQDTPQEEGAGEALFFGKYKTKEEAETAFKEMERDRTESKEALDREQRLNALLASESHTQPRYEETQPASRYTSLQNVFDEEQTQAVSQLLAQERAQILEQVRAEGRNMLDDYKVRQDTETKFYQDYKDLNYFKEDVDAEANKLAIELGVKASKIPLKDLMKEVAKRTREKLATQKSKLTKTPLHVEDGEVVEPNVTLKSSKPKESSEAERTQAFFDDEVTAFNERKFKPLRG